LSEVSCGEIDLGHGRVAEHRLFLSLSESSVPEPGLDLKPFIQSLASR
jgi:hypothetical protein